MELVQNTIAYQMLLRAKRLSEGEAWLESFTPDLKTAILERWIQQDQLFNKGVDSNGRIIGYYSFATQVISGGRKKAGDPYTLYDTGDFYRSMFLNALKDEIEIGATSNSYLEMKADQDWWREEILGLTDENIQKLIEAVKVRYRQYLLRVLQIH